MPFIIYIFGLTTFILGTAEFMVAGMQPALSLAFNVPVPDIGKLISFYAFGMVIGGPLLTLFLLKLQISYKHALVIILLIFAGTKFMAAITHNYEVLALIRVISGMAAAAAFGLTLSLSGIIAPPILQARAFAIAIGGLMLAMVLGVPLATVIEYLFNWRISFAIVGAIALSCTLTIAFSLQQQSRSSAINLKEALSAFIHLELWAAYTTSALIIGATFAAFSYLTPILLEISHFPLNAIPWIIGLFGLASVIGNFIVGRYANPYYMWIMLGGLLLMALTLLLFGYFAHYQSLSILFVIMVGLLGISMNPAMIYRIATLTPLTPLISTVHTSIINIGLGMATWIGGTALDAGYSLRTPLWIGALLAIIGALILCPFMRSHKSRPGAQSN